MPSQMVALDFRPADALPVLANPLTSTGDRFGPGWSDVLNGGLGLLFLILAGVSGVIALRRAKRSRG